MIKIDFVWYYHLPQMVPFQLDAMKIFNLMQPNYIATSTWVSVLCVYSGVCVGMSKVHMCIMSCISSWMATLRPCAVFLCTDCTDACTYVYVQVSMKTLIFCQWTSLRNYGALGTIMNAYATQTVVQHDRNTQVPTILLL